MSSIARVPAQTWLSSVNLLVVATLVCLVLTASCAPPGVDSSRSGTADRSPLPPPTAAEIETGRGLYLQHGCGVCHGLDGSGDGPRAAALQPPPRDYRDRSAYRRGADAAAVAASIALGIAAVDGMGGMPAYPHLSEADRVAVAHFVVSLQREPAEAKSGGEDVPFHEDAAGADEDATVVEISDAWLRAAPPTARMGAGYMMLDNRGGAADAIVGVRSDVAETVELHHVFEVDGAMHMEPVERIALPAGAVVRLEPGGFHLMLIGLLEPLEAGATFTVHLELEGGTTLTLDVPVRTAEEMQR